ncbi:MAG: hypothetical protein ABS42_00480 [Bdellovibrio sp. SCN 50-8]|nr:MAG: hypothetical protein ABS42_00480 [Bdellovibrio sp. SCN 50-8]
MKVAKMKATVCSIEEYVTARMAENDGKPSTLHGPNGFATELTVDNYNTISEKMDRAFHELQTKTTTSSATKKLS